MEERAKEVYKWILVNINGWPEEDVKNIDTEGDYMFQQLLEIIEDGKKFNEV